MISASPSRAEVRTDGANPYLRALTNVTLATVSAIFLVIALHSVINGGFSALDFRYAYWSGGHRVLTGADPYSWTVPQLRSGVAFVYPALSALLFAPAALLTRSEGATIFTLLSFCVAPATLALLDIRDWRVYTVALIWLPVCAGWLTANESLFMALGLAAAWRWRDRPLVIGFLTAAMLSLKPLLWPLALWLLITRRWRASVYTVIWGLGLNLVAWGVVGFDRIGTYLHVVGIDASDNWRLGFGVPALLGHLGVGRGAGTAVMLVATAALAAALLYSGLVKRNEVHALIMVVALTLISSPLLWSHYLAILLVPLAVLRPRLNWLWILPVPMWICPPDAHVGLWQAAYFWIATVTMLIALTLQARKLEPAAYAPLRLRRLGAARAAAHA